MHRLLIRQLQHILGIEDAGHWLALNQAIDDFSVNLAQDNPLLAQALDRMPVLLEAISRTYGQHERHLSLLRSGLETSSREMTEVHDNLRAEISGKSRSLETLHGALTRLTGVATDCECDEQGIDGLAQKLICLSEERELMRQALATVGDGALVTDRHGHIRFLNAEAEQLTGWALAEAEGVSAAEVAMLLDETSGRPLMLHPVLRCRMERTVISNAPCAMLLTQDHRLVAVEHSASPVLRDDGKLAGIVMILRDVSSSRETGRETAWQASHDPLTGLRTRGEFERRLESLIRRARTGSDAHTLLQLDLDQFKRLNDSVGRAAGDELLKQVGSVLRHQMRHTDCVARLGSDEFGVLLADCPLAEALRIGECLLDALRELRFSWGESVFDVGAACGLVVIYPQTDDASSVLVRADMACCAAKELGRNRIHVHTPNDVRLTHNPGHMHRTSHINDALAQDRFRLYAQEIRPLGEDKDTYFEILLRLIDPSGKEIMPGEFIPAAERHKLMGAIDRWVIAHTLDTLASANCRSGEIKVAINLSAASLTDHGLAEFLRQQLRSHKISAQAIRFEVTETAAVSHLSTAADLIQNLTRLGCKFALDDFGCTNSSFAHLKNLPVDYLKIDGRFVRDLASDPVSRALVESINRIGQLMGRETIAKCVESEETLRMLGPIGVDYAQGYAVSRPLPLPDWLATLAFAGLSRSDAA